MLLSCFKTVVGCYGGRPYCTVHILGRSSSQSRCVYSIFSLLRLRSALSTLLELMRSVLSMNRGYAFDLYDLRRDPFQREGWESDTYCDIPQRRDMYRPTNENGRGGFRSTEIPTCERSG